MKFLATPCLISQTNKPEVKPRVLEFIEQSSLVVSAESLTEIQRGIVRIARTKPEKAAELREWYAETLHKRPLLSGREDIKASVLATMLEQKELRCLWLPAPKAQHPAFGYHIALAATAVAYGLPIAGIGIQPFVHIDRYFSLPGLYDVTNAQWVPHAVDSPKVALAAWAPAARWAA